MVYIENPIIVLGAEGQLGAALLHLLGERAIGLTKAEADFTQPEKIPATLVKYEPSAIFNAAAYTAVDRAEEEEELAHVINAKAPEALAIYAHEEGMPFIHYSTDYVFNGKGKAPWQEIDATAPISAYGRTKLAGEEKVASVGGDHLIFRTSWVYDAGGKNFLNTMLRVGKERESLKIVDDQIGAPTYAEDLARASIACLTQALQKPRFPAGVYHLCNAGEVSWFGFAKAIFQEAAGYGVELAVRNLEPIPTSDYPTPARRPLNSRLDTTKMEKAFGVHVPEWQDGLHRCMESKFG